MVSDLILAGIAVQGSGGCLMYRLGNGKGRGAGYGDMNFESKGGVGRGLGNGRGFRTLISRGAPTLGLDNDGSGHGLGNSHVGSQLRRKYTLKDEEEILVWSLS